MSKSNPSVFGSVLALGLLVFSADLLVTAELSAGIARPKAPAGKQCITYGEERKTVNEVNGQGEPTGRKFDCLFDYCEYCNDGSANVACGSRTRTYDNDRDCKQVASRPGAGGAVIGPQTIDPGVLDPGTSAPPTRGPRQFRPGGILQRN